MRCLVVFVSCISVSLFVAFGWATLAFAHVVVKPNEVPTATFQTFTVSVPNEKNMPTTAIKLIIPDGLSHVTPTQKINWKIATSHSDKKDTGAVTAITWSNGHVAAGMRDDFTFSAQTPAKLGELEWKAYQTYADGTVVSWDKKVSDESHENSNSGPFSVTKIIDKNIQEATDHASQIASEAQANANRAMYIAIGAVAVSLLTVALVTRKK